MTEKKSKLNEILSWAYIHGENNIFSYELLFGMVNSNLYAL